MAFDSTLVTSRRQLLSDSVQYLKGVGPRRAELFARMGVSTCRDLLYHLPHRYEDATTVDAIASLRPGDDATVIGRVVSKGVLLTRRKLRVFHAVLRDSSGLIECAWPGRPWLDRSISKGDLLLVSGPVRFYHGRQLQPREHTVLAGADEQRSGVPAAGKVFPIYPATEGLTHRQVRAIMEVNLDTLLDQMEGREPLPDAWLEELELPPLHEALATLHRPASLAEVEPARRRLAFGELFFLQLLHARARAHLRGGSRGIPLKSPGRLTARLFKALPFQLTNAQVRSWREIEADLERKEPMNRLLQGDVGSGKTVVAAAAMLKAAEAGCQAALMAPTELLAEQHRRTLTELLAPVGLEPALLTGAVAGGEREGVLAGVADGSLRILIGTHALIQEGVAFSALALAVIDEQHRFGVEQRRALRQAGSAGATPHALVMSATPIPRSLALALYGDLDISVIDEMPPGRKAVVTGIRGPESREAAFEFLEQQLAQGRQGYVVYPLIEESEALEARAASAMHEKLSERFSSREVGLLHGRMKTKEKESVMRRFLAGEIHLLVATTVIEVGIDVPNASIMLIEDAERFGLAQLHQLRGRVGRGAEQSYCVAFYSGRSAPERLRAFAATTDGFALAEEDLRLRGQGDFFGREQHGAPALRFAQLDRDASLLREAHRRARAIVEEDPELSRPDHRHLRRELTERYGEREALYKVG
ncbi:MAG: ATP-dependent DNA helicase RecG [Gemmatimonadota bacterium]